MTNVHPFIKPQPKPKKCSFCDRPEAQVPGELLIGQDAYRALICADCVKHAHTRCIEESKSAGIN